MKTTTSLPERSDRPLRADARRSRRLILDAARVVFARKGIGAGFDEIARAAGVGVGTVYRRFPQREDLVDALFAERMEEVVAMAEEALLREDPWLAVEWFVEQSVEARRLDRGLDQVLMSSGHGHARTSEARDGIEEAVGRLITRAQRAGVLRGDIEAIDIGLVIHLLSQAATDARPGLWRRYLDLFLDSLRARPDARDLREAAPTVLEFAEIASRT